MTQTIDSTHYEMIETDRQGNKAYINVDIKKYVDCILNHKYMCTMIMILRLLSINKRRHAYINVDIMFVCIKVVCL